MSDAIQPAAEISQRQMNEAGSTSLGQEVAKFAVSRSAYYEYAFLQIQNAKSFVFCWNLAAILFGPLWAAARGLWGFFWIFLVLEMFAFVQLGRGLWGDLGAEQMARYDRLIGNINNRLEQAEAMRASGDIEGAEGALHIAGNLQRAADAILAEAQAAANALPILLVGIALFIAVKALEGAYANYAYERQYLRWRSNPAIQAGISWNSAFWGGVLFIAILPLTLMRFTVSNIDARLASLTNGVLGEKITLTAFPVGREYFAALSIRGDRGFDWLANKFGGVFDGITFAIRTVLDGIEVVLIQTPWPVVMLVVTVMAFRLAGVRVAIFTAAALAYLAFMGLWEISMITVALIGTGAFLCVLFGIPLGVWFGKSKTAYRFAEPVLDFMQTMPAFVYLIPIIAFFGTGKPPGVLATLIFAMPPVIRLTALGIRGVPDTIKEAAVAYGCTRWQLLRNVELPLAMPSIMTGVNQTILMSLSMVVIASLIGAQGLGALILEALQYAAKGQGLLGGLAILLCAMVIDRIAQGFYRKKM